MEKRRVLGDVYDFMHFFGKLSFLGDVHWIIDFYWVWDTGREGKKAEIMSQKPEVGGQRSEGEKDE